ncbi:rhomboid family intramembrane serine protease [Hymenobacter sp. HSC-4F20]|uniref:rhomboid family intramembrane serine protease n=1 Tax=Hymenobacter sp. HSC-4F20 TaxID=2864135 RepID=UPI001C730F4F|nr:rhomboid family intramembrane serine protease [Hymenobacter sp. HSC-4F20]MBX0292932.1 rhomboid family intramembrane serine protease [Hymenobacter sp. HSC-4F20]
MPAPDPAALFAQKTDAELLYLAQHAPHYPAAVGRAAVQELQRRGLIPTELPALPSTPAPAPEPELTAAGLLWGTLKGIAWPRPGYRVTPFLLGLNVLVYLAMAAAGVSLWHPSGADLIRWGSNVTSLTPTQPWRLLTSCFLHGGVAHLVTNMASLLFLGLLTERLVGGRRFLTGYLLSGLGGSLLSWWWHTQGLNSVGASGAIFGLYGLLLCTLVRRPAAFTRSERYTVLLFVLYLVAGSLATGLQTHTTDNAAHLGGLLVGATWGLLVRPHR